MDYYDLTDDTVVDINLYKIERSQRETLQNNIETCARLHLEGLVLDYETKHMDIYGKHQQGEIDVKELFRCLDQNRNDFVNILLDWEERNGAA